MHLRRAARASRLTHCCGPDFDFATETLSQKANDFAKRSYLVASNNVFSKGRACIEVQYSIPEFAVSKYVRFVGMCRPCPLPDSRSARHPPTQAAFEIRVEVISSRCRISGMKFTGPIRCATFPGVSRNHLSLWQKTVGSMVHCHDGTSYLEL